MSKRVRQSTGMNDREFELALQSTRNEAALRFLPRTCIFGALGLLVFAAFDVVTDPQHFSYALRWRIGGAALLFGIGALARLKIRGLWVPILLSLPATLLVWAVTLAALELDGALLKYSGSIGLMIALAGAWISSRRWFIGFNIANVLLISALGRSLMVPADQWALTVNLLLGSLCGAMFFDFIYRLNRRALRLQLELKTESRTDPLTGLPNRRAFLERAEDLAQRARRRGKYLAVLLIDADHFKRINDQYGHDIGDAVLQALAGAIANAMGGPADCGRLGGEEFAVLLQELDPDAALQEALNLVEQIRLFDWVLEGLPTMRISVGVASANGAPSFSALLRQADLALYSAKHAGRDQARLPPEPLDLNASNGNRLENLASTPSS